MGPELMGTLEIDGLLQRCALIATPCVLTLLSNIPNATVEVKAMLPPTRFRMQTNKLYGFADMMASGSTSIVLSPVDAQAHLDVSGVPKPASLLIGSDALETLIIVGTPDGITLTLSPLSASASGNAFAVGASALHIQPRNPPAFMTAPGAGSVSMTLASSVRAAQTAPGDGGQVIMHLASARVFATLISPIYVGTDIDAPMSRFMDDTMADFMFTEVV